MVISAHPDDEILGAGGTLIRHKEKGDEIAWLIVTNIFVEHGFNADRVKLRQQEIDKVASATSYSQIRLDKEEAPEVIVT